MAVGQFGEEQKLVANVILNAKYSTHYGRGDDICNCIQKF
jgi:hypothetical protein